MLKVLITGATGEIGASLVRLLNNEGYFVVALTRKKTSRAAKKLRTLNCLIYQGNIEDPSSLLNIPKVDGVFHLAAMVNPNADRNKLWKTNVQGTKNILEWSARKNVKKFVFASSVDVVGRLKLKDIPADVDYKCHPFNSYGETKLAAEEVVRQFHHENIIPTTIARIGGVYTDHNHSKNKHIDKWILSFMAGHESESRYKLKRRYVHLIHIIDVINGLKVLYENPKSDGMTYFLVGNEYATDEEIFHLVGFFMGYDDYIDGNFKTLPVEEAVHQAFSSEMIRRELGYSPLISLKDGVARKIIWYHSAGIFSKWKEIAKVRIKKSIRPLRSFIQNFR